MKKYRVELIRYEVEAENELYAFHKVKEMIKADPEWIIPEVIEEIESKT